LATTLYSDSNGVTGVASASAGLLYGIGGCILGVLWLLRRHWLLWRPAFVAGLIVGALLAPGKRWRVAVNQQMADLATPLRPGDEIAFFPPVTGG